MCEMSCMGSRRDVTISRELLLAFRDSAEGDFLTCFPPEAERRPKAVRLPIQLLQHEPQEAVFCMLCSNRSLSRTSRKNSSWKFCHRIAGLKPPNPSLAGHLVTQTVGISTCYIRVNWIERNMIVLWWLTAPELLCENPHTPLLHCLATMYILKNHLCRQITF